MTQPDTFSRARGNYDLVVTLFVALLLISNVAATKLIAFGPEWSPFGLPVRPYMVPVRAAGPADHHRRRRAAVPAHLRVG